MIPTLHDAVRSVHPNAATISGNEVNSLNAFDVDGNSVEILSAAVESKLIELQNKNELSEISLQAKQLLQQTDWATLSDIATGSPRLANQMEFIAYRQSLRAIAINPSSNPVWPQLPIESWIS